MQELVDDINAPDVLAEREHCLNVWLAGDIAIPVFVATNAYIRYGVVIAHIFLEFVELHLLCTPTGLWRGQKATHCFQIVLKRIVKDRFFCCFQSYNLTKIDLQIVYQFLCLFQFTLRI